MKMNEMAEQKNELLSCRLSREYINSLPIIRFAGEVVIVEDESHAERVLTTLMSEKSVGFDTESRPSFTKGTTYPVALIQLATPDTAYLFQLKRTGFSSRLVEFLETDRVKKIGVGVKNDIEKLQELCPFTAGGFIDLSKMAAEKGIIQVGLRALTARYIGHRLTKTAQKTNWAQPVLSPKQQIYAASDAWICLQIFPLLRNDNTDYRQFKDGDEKKRESRTNPDSETSKKQKQEKKPKTRQESSKSGKKDSRKDSKKESKKVSKKNTKKDISIDKVETL
jgi:ribonuclease D